MPEIEPFPREGDGGFFSAHDAQMEKKRHPVRKQQDRLAAL